MEYTLRPLTPQDGETFADYLAHLDFSHAPYFSSCFCRYYHVACSDEAWMERSALKNRTESVEAIQEGRMKGYLAFYGDACVGWLNANALETYDRLLPDLAPYAQEKKTGVVICFVLHPDHRGKGLATQMLEKALDGFKAEGFAQVLGLSTLNPDVPVARQYSGRYAMFQKLGFEDLGPVGGRQLMRKIL